jgi:hypothetical protein
MDRLAAAFTRIAELKAGVLPGNAAAHASVATLLLVVHVESERGPTETTASRAER